MERCPRCHSNHIETIEYSYQNPEHYDGFSEWKCQDCGYRQGRWTGKELPNGYIESRLGTENIIKAEATL